jgi:hypothetical protein
LGAADRRAGSGRRCPTAVVSVPSTALSEAPGASTLRLLNVREPHLPVWHELRIASALLTTKLLQSLVAVVAEGGDIGVVRAEGDLADRQGPL